MKDALTQALVWLKANWKFVSTILVIVFSFAGVKLSFRAGDPNSKPEIIIVIPTEDGFITQEVFDGRKPIEDLEYFAARIVLRVAIVILERQAPRTESEWDDRLLALLKLLVESPQNLIKAERAFGK